MLHVTERAIDEFAQMRAQNNLEPDRGVGIVPQADGGLQVAAVQPGPADQVIEREGEPVLVVPAELEDRLDGLVLDYRDDGDVPQFTLTRPDAGAGEMPAT